MTEELREALECRDVVLESASCGEAESRGIVFVFQVNLAGARPLAEPRQVVKFSKRPHALPRAECLKLATPQHYRHNFESAPGIHDDREATYQEDLHRYLARRDDAVPGRLDARHVSGHVTYSLDHFLMFCASVKPRSDRELTRRADRISAESATTIREPSEFAREMGVAVLVHMASLDVNLSLLDGVLELVASLHDTGPVVWVHHGPVLYSDDPQALVDSFPDRHRAIPVAFIKRQKFEWQQEYRFTVQFRGAPRDEVAYLPVPATLRRLTHINWERSR